MIRQQLNDDLKAAMLAKDAVRLDTLRGLKTAIQYADVAVRKAGSDGISDDDVMSLLAKEAKKRQESADLYVQGGSSERAEKELAEKAIIETYLPEQLSAEELGGIVDEIIKEQNAEGMQAMGKVIGAVKAKTGNAADGALIAKIVKEKLS